MSEDDGAQPLILHQPVDAVPFEKSRHRAKLTWS
jgi:hypothetical protein